MRIVYNLKTTIYLRKTNFDSNDDADFFEDTNTCYYSKYQLKESIRSFFCYVSRICIDKDAMENLSQSQLGGFSKHYRHESGIIRNELKSDQLKICNLFFNLLDLVNFLEIKEIKGSIYKLIKLFLVNNPNLGRKGVMSEDPKNKFSSLIKRAQDSVSKSDSFSENLEELEAELEKEEQQEQSKDGTNEHALSNEIGIINSTNSYSNDTTTIVF